eukprot:TRINITY_DN1865_c0_g1_i1.p1 TRINITY_DN1865_c0_g1~~TRINITY_DN1865_c0_g1_i1.p1  ORF type:complete len:378 (-),score=-52.62 TRINITY_DN1865_c0_g1_i1:125-1258(-)
MEAVLAEDEVETVLGQLPVRDLVKASIVCRNWQRMVSSSRIVRKASNGKQQREPWIFVVDHVTKAFVALDPVSGRWLSSLPFHFPPLDDPDQYIQGAAGDPGVVYYISGGRIRYGWLSVRPWRWHETPSMRWWRQNPVVCHVRRQGVLFVGGGAWETEDDAVEGCVEIFHLGSATWETCTPLPDAFRKYASASWILAASDGDDRILVLERFSGKVLGACFYFSRRSWGPVFGVRMPEKDSGCLLPRSLSLVGGTTRGLLLSGLTTGSDRTAVVWKLTDHTGAGEGLEATEICRMPREMARKVTGMEGGLDEAWYSLASVGSGDLLFFHSDRTDALAVCHLSTLKWTLLPLKCHVNIPLLSRKFLCAPVTIDQVFPLS